MGVLLKDSRVDHLTIYDNKGRAAMDLSEDRQYWDLFMKFLLRDMTEGRQSIVIEEQQRHEEEDAVAKYICHDLLKNHKDKESVKGFKRILYEICGKCIALKKPIDSTLYIIAYEMSNNYEKNKFCDLILNATETILDNKKSTKLDTAWLKKYLLKCCIWQKKYYEPCEKVEDTLDESEGDTFDDEKGGNEELKKLRTENKRLKKIINDIRN